MKSTEPPNDTGFFFGLNKFAVDRQLSEVEDWLSADCSQKPSSHFSGNVQEIIASKSVIAGETAMMPSLFTDHGPPSMEKLSRLLLQYIHRFLSVGVYLPVILLMVGRVVCVRAILFEPSF